MEGYYYAKCQKRLAKLSRPERERLLQAFIDLKEDPLSCARSASTSPITRKFVKKQTVILDRIFSQSSFSENP